MPPVTGYGSSPVQMVSEDPSALRGQTHEQVQSPAVCHSIDCGLSARWPSEHGTIQKLVQGSPDDRNCCGLRSEKFKDHASGKQSIDRQPR